MSTLDQQTAYEKDPNVTDPDFTPFYVTVAVCAVFIGSIVILNIIFGCCSKHRLFWKNRNTGNLWVLPCCCGEPLKQPPTDLTNWKDFSHFEKLQPAPRLLTEDIEAQAEKVPTYQQHI